MTIKASDKLGRYQVLEPLGAGGMGVVYKAVEEDSGAFVAIKSVSPGDRRRVECIRREIHALRRIEHPGVVRILDEGEHAGSPWYAMELMEDHTLRDWLRLHWAGPLHNQTASMSALDASTATAVAVLPFDPGAEPEALAEEPSLAPERLPEAGNGRLVPALDMLARLCRALAWVHGLGLVHGDLKPDNVVVCNASEPVLVDFGLVSLSGGRRSREVLDSTGQRAGTYTYMSPEQIRGDLVDARTDLYALGVMLFEAVVGRPPFTATSFQVMHAHLTTQPPRPSRLVHGVPPELESLILTLLSKLPADRPGHADDVATRLERLCGRVSPGTATAPPYLYRAGFAGRDAQMRALLAQIPRGRSGGMILIGGESGVGKTRFAMETIRSFVSTGYEVINGECVPLGVEGAAAPLQPLQPFLTAVVDLCWDGGEAGTDRLLGVRGKRLGRVAPALLKLPALAAYRDPPHVPDEVARQQLMNDLRETLEAFAAERAVVLVLDDLQWADELTLRFLRSLEPAALMRAGIWIVGTWRVEEGNEDIDALVRRAGVVTVRLERLEEGAVGQMVAEMLALRAPPEDFVRFVSVQSEGNPFFVAEYLREAMAEGVLRRDQVGRWVLPGAAHSFTSLSVPGGVRELVNRRLERLSARATTLLEWSAVLGREFGADLLFGLVKLDERERFEAMEELIVAHVVEEDMPGHIRFLHDKLREGAYARLSGLARRRLHGEVAEAIEAGQHGTDQTGRRFGELAHHWRIAQRPRKLIETLEQAGQVALASQALADALRYFEEALEIPESVVAVGSRRRARWARLAGRAAFSLGDLDKAERHTSTALKLLEYSVPRSPAGWGLQLVRGLGRQIVHRAGYTPDLTGLPDDVRDDMREGALAAALLAERFYFQNHALALFACAFLSVNLGEATGFDHREGTPYAWIAYAAGSARLHKWARWYFDRAFECSSKARDAHGQAFARILESVYAIGFARFEQASGALGEASTLVDTRNDPQNAELIQTCLGHIEYYRGGFESSRRRYEDVLASARARDNAQHTSWGMFSIARSLIRLGRFGEALSLLRESLTAVRERGDLASEIIVEGLRAEACLRVGDDAEARAAADRAYELMITSSPTAFSTLDGYWGASVTYLDLWRRKDDSSGLLAERVKGCASALRKLSRMFPLAAPAALLYEGELLQTQGSAGKAAEHFAQSLELAERLGMPYDGALARVAMSQCAQVSATERDALLSKAWKSFVALGCVHHMRMIESIHRPAMGGGVATQT